MRRRSLAAIIKPHIFASRLILAGIRGYVCELIPTFAVGCKSVTENRLKYLEAQIAAQLRMSIPGYKPEVLKG